MNILDIILLICLIPAIFQGLRKGFISQAISIVSLVAGIWMSAKFADIVTEWVSKYLSASEQVLKLVSFILILIGVFIVLGLIGRLLEATFKFVMLGWLNRLLGLVFSLAKALLILSMIIVAFNSLNNTFGFVNKEVLDGSILYPPLKDLADTIFPYLKNIMKFN